jgi:hypothetical protein
LIAAAAPPTRDRSYRAFNAKEVFMKTIIPTLALAALFATSAVAQAQHIQAGDVEDAKTHAVEGNPTQPSPGRALDGLEEEDLS